MSKTYLITIDGIDKIGKTTQINLLEKHFINNHTTVFSTRSIGGPTKESVEYFTQLKELIFNSCLPKDVEEIFFACSSFLNLRMISNLQKENKYKYIIQDRGMFSHIAYGLAKGNNRNNLEYFYKEVCYYMNYCIYNPINICLLPNTFDWYEKRLLELQTFNTEYHNRIEKLEFQKKVYKNMIKEYNLSYTNSSKFIKRKQSHILFVKQDDNLLDIQKKILNIIEKTEKQ